MTFAELVTEACDRGFTDMLDGGVREARVKRYVNAAHREVVDIAPWPFLPTEIEGTAPIEITDLAHVLSVSDVTEDRPIDPIDERQIAELDPDRDDTGSPIYWYRTDLTHLAVWPTGSSTLKVRYVRRAVELVEPGDEPLTPEEYDELLISGTVIRLYRSRDNFEAAQFERQEWQRGLEGMKHALLRPNYDRPSSIARSGCPEDYLE